MLKKEIVIVGGGPAGLGAAIEAAKAGAKVLLIDENRRAGGQLFKQIHKFFGSRAHNAGVRGIDIAKMLLSDTEAASVEVWLNSPVIGLFKERKVAVVRKDILPNTTTVVEAERILLATGASENAVNFPGWTLPGVMGAGAAQTMINVNRVLPGRRVLMLGSGNVGLIVTYQLMQAGAEVVGIVEAANRIGGYGVHAAKVSRAGVPFYLGHTIVRATGDEQVSRAVIAKVDEHWKAVPGTEIEMDVDTVCLAAGLRPLSELGWMLGLKHESVPALGGWMPLHNKNMESTVPGIYVAGDTAGVEEANTAMDEGRLAGIAMAQELGYIAKQEGEARKEEIRQRLAALRMGPFGEKRLRAKEKYMQMGCAI
jgi:NADPH-dependent 2,4-dienoyl-CoA reductase/sulfur reductase-like enzyme